ncbi:MAG TPA: hypothetical protein VKV35_12805 [Streptosporangiaceae bacterium]|nr:hypothetical protein [Streptosporangiaceae bacterium]
MTSRGAGPFRWFRANVVRLPCPDCGCPTAAGFDRDDTLSPPARCAACSADAISNEIQFSRARLGYPVTEQGPCARCRAPARIYGPHGRPVCPACRPQAAGPPTGNPAAAATPRARPPAARPAPGPEHGQPELSA